LGTSVTSWDNAKADCEAQGGYLASIGSSDEATLIYDNTPTDTWIGAFQGGYISLEIIWEAPAPSCVGNWAIGEPTNSSEDCVELRDNGEWHDRPCAEVNSYLCERGR
jgi:hypothetical protein